jgi:molybdenum cofactor cytidylyltransferase
MTLPLGDRTVIEHTIGGMLPFVGRVIVVLGWHAERLRALLAGRPDVSLVHNDQFREGMFSSVRAGIREVNGARFFLLPGDQPLISPEVYTRLLSVDDAVVIPTYQGQRGHPVLLSRDVVPDILAMPAEATLRDAIQATGYSTVDVDDDAILLDLDTAKDYALILSRYRAEHGLPGEQDG